MQAKLRSALDANLTHHFMVNTQAVLPENMVGRIIAAVQSMFGIVPTTGLMLGTVKDAVRFVNLSNRTQVRKH